MKKKGVIRRLARQEQIPTAAAADHVDRVVHEILTRLRKGQPVSLPGLGPIVAEPQKHDHDQEK